MYNYEISIQDSELKFTRTFDIINSDDVNDVLLKVEQDTVNSESEKNHLKTYILNFFCLDGRANLDKFKVTESNERSSWICDAWVLFREFLLRCFPNHKLTYIIREADFTNKFKGIHPYLIVRKHGKRIYPTSDMASIYRHESQSIYSEKIEFTYEMKFGWIQYRRRTDLHGSPWSIYLICDKISSDVDTVRSFLKENLAIIRNLIFKDKNIETYSDYVIFPTTYTFSKLMKGFWEYVEYVESK